MSPFVCWQNVYPNVATLARVYLTHSASSVPVERLFSVTTIIKNARIGRQLLRTDPCDHLRCVDDNGKFFQLCNVLFYTLYW